MERFPTSVDVLRTKKWGGYTVPAIIDVLDQFGWPVCTWRLAGHDRWIVTSHSERFDRAFQSVFANEYADKIWDLLGKIDCMWFYKPTDIFFHLLNGRQGTRHAIVD